MGGPQSGLPRLRINQECGLAGQVLGHKFQVQTAIPSTSKRGQIWWHELVMPSERRRKQADLWGLLAGQPR